LSCEKIWCNFYKMENTFHIQWHINDRCNLRCLHCYQDIFTSERELSFPSLKDIFENIREFLKEEKKLLVVDITGGEPFLHDDFFSLIEFLISSEVVKKVGIITNGFFLDKENLNFLERFKKIEIKISAEGVDKETYELFRGKGNFEKFVETCNLLKSTNLKKTLMFTLLESNFSEVKKLFDFIENFEFDRFVVERFIPWGRGRKIQNQVISLKNWMETVKILFKKTGVEEIWSEILPYRAFMVERLKGEYNLFGAPCIIGKDGCAVMPDGSVFPCRRFPLSLGNLKETQFSEIWRNSEILKNLREKKFLKGRCKICKINDCNGCRAIAYSLTGDFFEEDPLCFLKGMENGTYS